MFLLFLISIFLEYIIVYILYTYVYIYIKKQDDSLKSVLKLLFTLYISYYSLFDWNIFKVIVTSSLFFLKFP